jgi:hypothetical protein
MSDFDIQAPTRRLRINGYGEVYVRDARQYLDAVESAYNGIYVFQWIFSREEPRMAIWPQPFPVPWPMPPETIDAIVPPKHKLVLASVDIASPGGWEFLAALNPLETIRKYLNDRHERMKDREYRNAAEKRRLEAEAEAAELRNVRERIGIYRELNVPVDVLADQLVGRPLRELGHAQDENLITTAQWVDEDEGGRDSSAMLDT